MASASSHFRTPDWVADAVFYQIFPDRFAFSEVVAKPKNLESWDSPPTAYGFKGGDFEGMREHLDYLSDLGINAIYLTPVFASTANHRYHTFDYFQIDPILGGNKAFESFLKDAHGRGMRVVLDGVFNHASRGFFQFNHTLENGLASPYLDWFHFDHQRLAAGVPLNAYEKMQQLALAPTVEKGLERLGYRAWWDLAALPKFNFKSRDVRDFILSVARFWLEKGIDGWRLDVPCEIDQDFWPEFRDCVKKINPEAYIVGEIWGEASSYLKGDQFDGVMNYLFGKDVIGFALGAALDRQVIHPCGNYRKIQSLNAPGYARHIEAILKLYPEQVSRAQMNVMGSHDTPRLMSIASGDSRAVQLAWTLLFTFPGAPCIYYGDEIGMTGNHDPDCRRGFIWDSSQWDMPMRQHLQHLIKLRHETPALRRGTYKTLVAEDHLYCFERSLPGQSVVVATNAGTQPGHVNLVIRGSVQRVELEAHSWQIYSF